MVDPRGSEGGEAPESGPTRRRLLHRATQRLDGACRSAPSAFWAARPRLERFHWFTVEFGLIQEQGEKRIFGAGIVSSNEEVTHALSDEVTLHPFDPEHIVEKDDYEVYNLQDELFVLESFEQLVDGFRDWTKSKGLL